MLQFNFIYICIKRLYNYKKEVFDKTSILIGVKIDDIVLNYYLDLYKFKSYIIKLSKYVLINKIMYKRQYKYYCGSVYNQNKNKKGEKKRWKD